MKCPKGARLIPLSQGKFAIVDKEDYEKVSKYKWCLENSRGKLYAHRKNCKRTIKMHRFILDVMPGFVIDHINGNSLDNRRKNLRICTKRDNSINRKPNKKSYSKYKGVTFHSGKWVAIIHSMGKRYYLGRFANEIDAAKACDKKLLELHGKLARLNFP